MKMVCKKLLSLVLVALMLVTALPFQASAAQEKINFEVKNDGVVVQEGSLEPNEATAKVSNILKYYVEGKYKNGELVKVWSSKAQAAVGANGEVPAGDTVSFAYVTKQEPVTPPETTKPADINWVVKHDGEVKDSGSFTPAAETSLVSDILKHKVPSNLQVGERTKIWSKTVGDTVTTDSYVPAGDTVTFAYTTKQEPSETTKPTETNPTEPKPTEHVHNYVEKERVEPTCGKDGYVVKKCDCGNEVKEVLKATGNHTWGGWVIQNEATATTEGTMIRTCSTCGQTETQKYTAKTKEISFQVTLDGETTTTKSVFVLDKTMSLPKPSVPSGYQFKGWFTEPNGKGAQLNDGTTCTENLANVYYGSFTKVSKFPYSVYLHIYETGNVKTPMKTVTLDTWTCVKDGVVTLDEIKEVVKTYYTAKTSDGIAYDGIYYSTSSTKTDYVNDQNKTDRINNLDELRRDGYVHLNVWVDNVKAKSDSNSNTSSNPKTGDTIYMAVTVMGLSAASLAAVYYISKKRAVR